ncbi:MAG: 7-carboxy-7-deazaguanine synthase QueE [Methanobrevibacter sp.]|nr:7-carboxy-7-deazaguanine synthase QueE [Methanobrevibacter sp.]
MKVNEIFYSFQGEGLYAGTPCIFLRLSQCNLNCPFCDTDYENYEDKNVIELVRLLTSLLYEHNTNLLVITGGEPLLQYEELKELISNLECKVQIETNGSIKKQILEKPTYIISPKEKAEKVFEQYHKFSNVYFKFLIKNQEDVELIKYLQEAYDYDRIIWLQPLYEKDKEITDLILENNLSNIRISGQLHKYLNQR